MESSNSKRAIQLSLVTVRLLFEARSQMTLHSCGKFMARFTFICSNLHCTVFLFIIQRNSKHYSLTVINLRLCVFVLFVQWQLAKGV